VTLGAQPKQVAVLCTLLVIAGITYYVTSSDSSPSPVASGTPSRITAQVESAAVPAANTAVRRTANRNLVKEFKPYQGTRDPKDRPDPATIDPTLRLDLLAKVQNIEVGAPGRNLFQFGSAPPPPAPVAALPKNLPKIATNAPPPPPVTQAGPPPPPQAPPMTFKYYGYKVTKSDGHKAAFLLDGEEILIAGENDTVKKHYRVVKIGINSITIEDTDFKSTQTLQLLENLAS
jgi:hypothetical protein